MGMDIYGMRPMGEPKQEYEDWAEKCEYEAARGIYFRSNLWWWRPLQVMLIGAIDKLGLDVDTKLFGSNDGAGIDNTEDCIKVADLIEQETIKWQQQHPHITDTQRIQCILHMFRYCDKNETADDETTKALTEKYGLGYFVSDDYLELDGVKYVSSYGTNIESIKEFCTFLRNCGGFEIW